MITSTPAYSGRTVVPYTFNGLNLMAIKHEEDMWLTGEDIGRALEYVEPRIAIQKLFKRNQNELKKYSCVTKLVTQTPENDLAIIENGVATPPAKSDYEENATGQRRSVRIFNEEGVMILTMLSSQPKAADFRAWAVTILKAYRHGNLVLANPLARERLLETCIKESRFGSPAAVQMLIEHFGFPPSLRRDINRDIVRRASRLPAKEPELLDWFLDTFLPRLRDEIEGTPGEILAGIRSRPPYYTNWGEMAVEGALWCLRHRPSDLFTFICPLAETEGVETDISSQLFTRWLSYNSARLKSGGWARVEHSRTQGWNVFRLMLVDGTGVRHG